MRRYQRFVALPAILLIGLAAACSSDKKASTTAPPVSVGTTAATAGTTAATTAPTAATTAATTAPTAATTTAPAAPKQQKFTVMVDGHVDSYNGAFTSYFPDKLSVHPGDTILFKSVFSGEPHSIAFGSVISDVIDGFRKLSPEQQSGQGPPPPELEAKLALVPQMIPDGPGDAVQTSVNPCFVAAGATIPTDPAKQCPVTKPAAFKGTETFYNSGFLPDGETFALKLADDIAPGTYLGMCTLHTVGMVAEFTVVPADKPIPSPADVLAEGQKQLKELAAKILPDIATAKATTTPSHVAAGVGNEGVHNVLDADFVLKDIQVKVGDSVTWTVNGVHTVSFNAPEDARTLLAKGNDGGYHLSEKAVIPTGFTPPDTGPPPTGGPPANGPPPPVDAGKWDGTGFFSSGIMFGGDFSVTFTKPGTFDYICLIHPNMKGTVTVG